MKIDKLALRLTGVSAYDAERLARRIGAGLAEANPGSAGHAAHIKVKVKGGGSMEQLSDRALTAVLRELERSLA